jgi:hypothetical protein
MRYKPTHVHFQCLSRFRRDVDPPGGRRSSSVDSDDALLKKQNAPEKTSIDSFDEIPTIGAFELLKLSRWLAQHSSLCSGEQKCEAKLPRRRKGRPSPPAPTESGDGLSDDSLAENANGKPASADSKTEPACSGELRPGQRRASQ